MSDVQFHRFAIGANTRGFAAPLAADRVGITFMTAGGPNWNTPMSAEEARAVANALYEAAEASEKIVAAAPATVPA